MEPNEVNYTEAARQEAAAAQPAPARRNNTRLLGAIVLGFGVLLLLAQGISMLVSAFVPARVYREQVVASAQIEREMAQVGRELELAAAEIEREMADVEREMTLAGADLEREMAGVEREMALAAGEIQREMNDVSVEVVVPPMPMMTGRQRNFGPAFVWPGIALGAALFKLVVVPVLLIVGVYLLLRSRRSAPTAPVRGPEADHAR